jgi:hypothetical protein
MSTKTEPTAAELTAFRRGEMSPDEEERFRERLVSYPELVRSLAEPFPDEGAEPGSADYLSDAEYKRHWAAMQAKRNRVATNGRVLPFWRAFGAVAAALTITFAALWWQARAQLDRPRVAWDEQVLSADGNRGPAAEPTRISARGDEVLLVAPLISHRDYERYRLDLVRANGEGTIWSTFAARPSEDGAFSVIVSRRFLGHGVFRLVIHGVRGGSSERLASYSFALN